MIEKSFNKIFQIGFNKCGTISLHEFFLANGLKSVHWDGGQLADALDRNYKSNLKLLTGYDQYDCYTDMENLSPAMDRKAVYAHVKYFKELDRQYPNSKFILNQRNVDDWIESRKNHAMGDSSYLTVYKKIFGIKTAEEVINQWRSDWQQHEIAVKKYFQNRPDDLLIFDVKTEPKKFIDFMERLIPLKSPHFVHRHKTAEKYPQKTSLKNNASAVALSIIIPCFNDGQYLPEALSSIEKITGVNYEVIIIDDGSTDQSTLEILNNLDSDTYHVIRQNHQGPSVARNNGIEKANGAYLLPLDADNKINPEYVYRGLKILTSQPEIDIVYSDRQEFGLSDKIISLTDFDINKISQINYIDTCAIFRSTVWEQCGGYDQNMDGLEDWEFWINAYSQGCKFYHLSEPLFYYRKKQSSFLNSLTAKQHYERLQYLYAKHATLINQTVISLNITKDELIKQKKHLEKIYTETLTKNERLEKAYTETLAKQSKAIEQKDEMLIQRENIINSIEKSLVWKSLKKFDSLLDFILGKETVIRKKYNQTISLLQNLSTSKPTRIKNNSTSFNQNDLANHYIKGQGIEIGALHNPLAINPNQAKVTYVDFKNKEELIKIYPEVPAAAIINPEIIAPADDLKPIGTASQDFVIANHLLEHLANPLKALAEFHRVLKPDNGILFLTVPNYQQTFDRHRDLTSLQHLENDYSATNESRKNLDFIHYLNWMTKVNQTTDLAAATIQAREIRAKEYPIHFHTFSHNSLIKLFDRINKYYPFKFDIVVSQASSQNSIFILQPAKNTQPSDQKSFKKLNRKKILFIVHEESKTGAPKILKELIDRLIQLPQFDCYILSKRIVDDQWLYPKIFRLTDLPGSDKQQKMAYLETTINPDLIIANSLETADLGKYFNCQKIIIIHEFRAIHKHQAYLNDLKKFNRVITVCQSSQKLLKHYGIKSRAMEYYLDFNPPNLSQPELTHDYVLTIGCVQHRKGIDRFFEIAEALPNHQFIWVGSTAAVKIDHNFIEYDEYNFESIKYQPPEPIRIKQRRLRIPANVKFVGLKSEAAIRQKWLPRAKLVLALSYDDPFPIVVAEAKILNKNIVTIKESGDSYQLGDNHDLVLERYDKTKIIDYINNLKTNKVIINFELIKRFKSNYQPYFRLIKANLYGIKNAGLKNLIADKIQKAFLVFKKYPKFVIKNPKLLNKFFRILFRQGPYQALQNAYDFLQLNNQQQTENFGTEVKPINQTDYHQYITNQNKWHRHEIEKLKKELSTLMIQPKISIVMPVYQLPIKILKQTIDSILKQIYSNWELCLANGSQQSNIAKLLDHYANDPRIKLTHLPANKGISQNSNEALKLAGGEFIALMDHDDELTPDALAEVVKKINQHPEADLIYSDEDKIDLDGFHSHPTFKPDWCPDLLLNVCYFGHLTVIRKEIMAKVGSLKPEYDGSQDHDLFLRITEITNNIFHIPKILYHWKMANSSVAADIENKPYCLTQTKLVLEAALKRRGLDGQVEMNKETKQFYVRYKLNKNNLVSIIIPTKDQPELIAKCVHSIIAKTNYPNYEIIIINNDSKKEETKICFKKLLALSDKITIIDYPKKFNYSAINNFGAGQANGDILLFLNDDTEIINAGWLRAMIEQVQRPEVGVVGSKLLYYNNLIQHAGVIVGKEFFAVHAFCFWPNSWTYLNLASSIRNYQAVTGACLMTKKELFNTISGFDESYQIIYSDIDLCLRLRHAGYLIVYTPLAELYHHESATRGVDINLADKKIFQKKWQHILEQDDPYYNPNLSPEAQKTFSWRSH
ncbi:MAG: glycosyltransferase [Patescibacteria group bacterium]|jgi:glycosyltransferase involved in cell wall biosynthesis|nr:glycosyltransferase [Patescibacteria group bacterium]